VVRITFLKARSNLLPHRCCQQSLCHQRRNFHSIIPFCAWSIRGVGKTAHRESLLDGRTVCRPQASELLRKLEIIKCGTEYGIVALIVVRLCPTRSMRWIQPAGVDRSKHSSPSRPPHWRCTPMPRCHNPPVDEHSAPGRRRQR